MGQLPPGSKVLRFLGEKYILGDQDFFYMVKKTNFPGEKIRGTQKTLRWHSHVDTGLVATMCL